MSRVFYAAHSVSVDGGTVAGAQSVAMNTTFNLEPVFELGKLEPIDILSLSPQVEATVTRAIVGGSIISGSFTDWACSAGGHSVSIGISDDCSPILGGGGSGMNISDAGISGATWTFTSEGIFTEEITFTGSSKGISASSLVAPVSAQESGAGVEFRPHFQGVSVGGGGFSGGLLASVTVSASIGREQLFALGQYSAVANYAGTPAEITYEIETYASSAGDGTSIGDSDYGCGSSTSFFPISVSSCGLTISSSKAAFAGVSYGGGDTGGGNATITYTYTAFNDLVVG